MIRGKKEGSNYSTWFIGFDHDKNSEDQTGPGGPGGAGPPPSSSSLAVGGSRPMFSSDTGLHLLSTPSPTSRQIRPRTPEPSRRLLRGGKDLDKSRPSSGSGSGSGSGGSSLLKALPKWDEDRPSKGQVKKVTKDLYKHAFESARQAEETKFRAKFDVLLHDLHQTLDEQSSQGIVGSFPSASYGEIVLSYRGKIKDLLIVFSRRLQLACESFDSRDAGEDHGQQVKQNVSRFMEDLLGESLDLTSDEAVSDLSSLSDDSANERHAFEDQIAQAVVSKILENHRREVHHGLRDDRRRHFSASSLIPEALEEEDEDDDDDNDQGNYSSTRHRGIKDTDISKDFQDLKNFVEETQSRSRQYGDVSHGVDSLDGEEGVTEFRGQTGSARASSGFDVRGRDRDFPPLPDFSDLEQIDFDSGEVDPDLVQMNLDVIPEETEEELEEEEAQDSQWRENWIFKGQGAAPHSASQHADKRRLRGQDDQPQYMMVPRPDENLAPRVGNRDVDQLSDLSENDDEIDDNTSFYPRTSEELARISRYKHSSTPPSLQSPSLIPSSNDLFTYDLDEPEEDSVQPRQNNLSSAYDMELELEDASVGTEDFVGPIVEPTQKELKLLDSLVPADGDDPKFIAAPECVTIQEGEPVKFSCRISGSQPVDVFWYREQAEVEELEEGEDVELQVEGDHHMATLYHVGKQHAGQYMCIALNDQGKAIKYLTVTVKDNKLELKKPEFLKELKDVEVPEGQSVKFRCKVKGYPPPRIYWYKDGCLLKSNKSCRIEKFGNRDYLLTLEQVTMDDDAEYMVVARNVAGEAKSSAQVIVEPQEDDHPTVVRSQARSSVSSYSDSGSERSFGSRTAASGQDVPVQGSGVVQPGRPQYEVPRVADSLRNSSTGSRGGTDVLADTMLVDADELSIVTQHLDDMERHLDLEDWESAHTPDPPPCQFPDPSDSFPRREDLGDAGDMDMDKRTQTSRKLTSNTLSVLQAAEEIIQQEKSAPDTSLADLPSWTRGRVPAASITTPSASHRTVPQLRPSPAGHHDPKASVFSGGGSTSSSALDFPDSGTVTAGSSLSQRDPSFLSHDEFASHLPALGDITGPYREEVSISVSANSSSGKVKNEKPSRVSSALAADRTEPQPYRRTREPGRSTLHTSGLASGVPREQKPSVPQGESVGSERQGVAPRQKKSVSVSPEGQDLVLNFGPKEISAASYSRDYEVKGRGRVEEDKGERRRWSVTLDPYSPSADVVNRQQPVEEAEEKERGDSSSTPQISPRSSRGGSSSNSSTISTSRESLDSGVSCAPFSPERPQPVHMVGETREEEVPESRAEYDADSGIELPSVSRLKAMFASSTKGQEGPRSSEGSNFKRVHSITARSLSKDQLQKLRDGGSPHQRESHVQSHSTIQLNSPSPLASSHGVVEDQPGKRPSAARTPRTPGQQQTPQQAQRETVQSAERRPVHSIHPSEYSTQRDPSGQSHLLHPEQDHRASSRAASTNSLSKSRTQSPRPKSVILGPVQDAKQSVIPRTRVQSDSDLAGNAGAASTPKIRSGCISARAAFWERRIQQGEGVEDEVKKDFPDMQEDSHP